MVTGQEEGLQELGPQGLYWGPQCLKLSVSPSLSYALVCTLLLVSAPYSMLAKFSSFHLPQLYIFPA